MTRMLTVATLAAAALCTASTVAAHNSGRSAPNRGAHGHKKAAAAPRRVNSMDMVADDSAAVDQAPKLKTLSHFLHLDASKPFQTIDHAGAAITESSATILMTYMTKADRTAFLQKVFGTSETVTDPTTGATTTRPKAHLSAVRLPMGASDFNINYYTYDDIPAGVSPQTDYDLKYFSIAKDEAVLIPLLKEIKAVNSNVKILATPWSAPGWMKDIGSMFGGTFLGKPCSSEQQQQQQHRSGAGLKVVNGADDASCQIFTTYANYFVKFVEAYYVQHGLVIDVLTLQNEPLNSNLLMPSMILPAAVEGPLGAAVYKGLVALSQKYGPTALPIPRLFGYDHNWDNIAYPEEVLSTAGEAPSQVQPLTPFSGAAFHCYGGSVTNQSAFQTAYPNVDIWMTECTGGGWAPNWADNLHWDASNLFIGNIENYGRSAFMWNLILTPEGGPRVGGGCTDCRGVFNYTKETNTIAGTEDWWPLQNFATAASLSTLSGNGGDVKRISATIDSMQYPLIVSGTVNTPAASSTEKKTLISMLLNINLSWCSSGAIHIPFFFSVTLPNSNKICKPFPADGSGRAVQLKVLCPSVSATVFALTDPNENWIMVELDQSYITRNETMTGLRYDLTDQMSDWQQYSNWTCV